MVMSLMKNIGFIALICLWAASCTRPEQSKYYTEEEVQRIKDSARNVMEVEAAKAAAEDLEYRMRIEIKSRMDSIKAIQQGLQ